MSTPSYFLIRSKLSGLVLDIPNKAGDDSVIMYSANGGSNQQWTINEQGVIQSKLNNLTLQGQNLWEKVVRNSATGTPAQQWVITPQGQILNKKNFLALEILGHSKDLFVPVVLAQIKDSDLSQQWEFVPVQESAPPTSSDSLSHLANKEFYIRNRWGCDKNESRCDNLLSFSGKNAVLAPKDSTADLVPWKLIPVPGKTDEFYIRNRWGCNQNEPRCDNLLSFSGKNLVLAPKDSTADLVPWKLIPVN